MDRKEDDLTAFARIAKEQGMTYGQLQKMETLGQIKVIDGQLFKVRRKRRRK